MSSQINYIQAIQDFHNARRKADLREIFARITGKSTELLSYEAVRRGLRAVEESKQELREIPLDAIVGSVGRYTDFSRDFLPLSDSDKERWAQVMAKTKGLSGLPPIEAYKISEVYFVLEGNHRVSVARQLGASHIEAFITEVRTRIPLTADTNPSDLILKAEYLDFLDRTDISHLCPATDLILTNPGQYPILEEHISVHRYYMGIEEDQPISYKRAAANWYNIVYCPIVDIIRERGILRHFPGRTETDLYLWLSKHKGELEETLGWSLTTEAAAIDLEAKSSQFFSRLGSKIIDIVIPDALESGPPVGEWRAEQKSVQRDNYLFGNILVTITGKEKDWQSLEQATIIALREDARIHGLHIIPESGDQDDEKLDILKQEFLQRCGDAGVEGTLAVEEGAVARKVCDRAKWTDLIVSSLSHPPADHPMARFSSGFRIMVRRCPRPVLAVPEQATALRRALLAYDNSPKAQEALYVAAYLAEKWGIPLRVVTSTWEKQDPVKIQAKAEKYLKKHGIQADYVTKDGPIAESILETASEHESDFVIMGGYGSSPIREVVFGSVVDEILRATKLPVLICR
ncbi:MAG: universal stress protein [Chloroflexota bacterium]